MPNTIKQTLREGYDRLKKTVEKIHESKISVDKGRYIFATGRRKTAIANIRLFQGKGELVVNKKPLKSYFQYSFYQMKKRVTQANSLLRG